MRYFSKLSYLGTNYAGWQRQPNAMSVQEKIEQVFQQILQTEIEITGCGRTDAGVHARNYVAHFDSPEKLPARFLVAANQLLPADIAIHETFPVATQAHARFDAFERCYEYRISLRKDPFSREMAWFFPQARLLDLEKLQSCAGLLPRFTNFSTFCKSDSGLESFDCEMKSAQWEKHDEAHELVFRITANRFLRGMVRLIVGACVNVALGKIERSDVEFALENQQPLKKSLSVPPQGLCLMGIKYPFYGGN